MVGKQLRNFFEISPFPYLGNAGGLVGTGPTVPSVVVLEFQNDWPPSPIGQTSHLLFPHRWTLQTSGLP